MFTPPTESILFKTTHWRVHHNLHSRVEGYLMLGTLHADGYDFDTLPSEALAEMGSVIERAVSCIKKTFQPKHVLVSRYGVAPGNQLHFHIIPIYEWLDQRIENDPSYQFLKDLSVGTDSLRFDAADYTLYIWRELTERAEQSGLPPIDLPKTIHKLSQHI